MNSYKGVIVGMLLVLAVIVGSLWFVGQQGGWSFGQIGRVTLSGNVVTEDRDVSGFEKILISGSGEATIEQGEEESLTVKTDEVLMPYVKAEVVGGELRLWQDRDDRIVPIGGRVEYRIAVKDVERVVVEGSGDVTSLGLETDELELKVAGSGDMSMNVEATRLVAGIDGSGMIGLTGVATEQQVTISGSGDFKGKGLEGETAEVSIDGSGDAELNATDSLEVSIKGSGKVRYVGKPEVNKGEMSGSGRVEKME